jgi:hypothetical protein
VGGVSQMLRPQTSALTRETAFQVDLGDWWAQSRISRVSVLPADVSDISHHW